MAGITIYVPTTTSAVADPVLVSNGTAAAPSYTFTSDPASGMYLSAVGVPAISSAGVKSLWADSANFAVTVPSGFFLGWDTKSRLWCNTDGNILATNNAHTGFGLLQFGSTTNAYPALKRSGTALAVRLADDSADAAITAGAATLSDNLTMTTTKTINWGASQTKVLNGAADGDFVIQSSTGTASTLYMGPSSGTGGVRLRATTNSVFIERSDGSTIAGNFSVAGSAIFTTSISVNTNNTTNVGIGIGGGANGIRIDYTGTALRYYIRDFAATGVLGFITQGQFCSLKTGAYSVVLLDAGTTFQNTGAGAQVVYTLPAATVGASFTFINTAAGATFTKALAVGSDQIAYNGTLGAAAGSLTSAAIWTSFKLVCHSAGVWVATAVVGTPTLA